MHAVSRLGLWKLYKVVVYTVPSHPDLLVGGVSVTEFATAFRPTQCCTRWPPDKQKCQTLRLATLAWLLKLLESAASQFLHCRSRCCRVQSR